MLRLRTIGFLAITALFLQAGTCGPRTLPPGFGDAIPFTAWDNINPGETVILNGQVNHVNYSTNLNTGETTAGVTFRNSGELTVGFDNNLDIESASINAGPASVGFDTNNGDIFTSASPLAINAESADGEDRAIFANVEALGFNYQTFGVWFTGFATGSGIAAVGTFGAPTLTPNVPIAGVATYNGGAAGFALDPAGNPFFVVSLAEVMVDFTGQTFTFETTGSALENLNTGAQFADSGFDLSGSGAINGAGLQGNVTAVSDLSGSIDGSLYGVNASEVGGLFNLSGPDGRYTGSFGAVD